MYRCFLTSREKHTSSSELPSTSVGSLFLIGRDIFRDNATIDNVGLAARSNVIVATADEPVADGKQKHEGQNNDGVVHLSTPVSSSEILR